jgi:hypothetical protein
VGPVAARCDGSAWIALASTIRGRRLETVILFRVSQERAAEGARPASQFCRGSRLGVPTARLKAFSRAFRSAHAAAGHFDCRFSIGDRPLLCSTTRRPDFTYENRALELSIFAALSNSAGFPVKKH